jgi:hypothetical protein
MRNEQKEGELSPQNKIRGSSFSMFIQFIRISYFEGDF